MKFIRLFIALIIGFLISWFLAATFFNYDNYSSQVDRLFLLAVPTLAIGFLLAETYPSIFRWATHIRSQYSLKEYFIGFLLALNFTYGAVGFLGEVLRTPFGLVLFTTIFITIGSAAGYILVGHAKQSLRSGFLSRPINLILALALPILLAAVIYAGIQFPSMFLWEYIIVPKEWMTLFIMTAVSAGVFGLFVLDFWNQTASRVNTQQQSVGFQNLPGLYAGGMFFLINLILARTLNHPALGTNSVLFESDAGPWMKILGSPQGDLVNRSVHPLSLIIIRPLFRLVGTVMGEHWNLGGLLVTAFTSGLCVFMVWLFVKRATESKTHPFIFSILLGSTATHLLFGSLTENYIFGAAALIFFFLLLQANEQRFRVLVPAGLLLFGITITNIAQGIIGLILNKFGFKRLFQYTIITLSLGVILTIITSTIYPRTQTLFFVPADIAFEFNFVKNSQGVLSDPIRLSEPGSIARKLNVVSRSILLYGVVGPNPIQSISKKPPFPTIDLKTFDVRRYELASYKGLVNIPLVLWLIVLVGSFITFLRNYSTSKHTQLMLGLLGAIGFNFLMHIFYGTELFLYSAYWVYAFVLFIALALSEFADNKWLQTCMSILLLAIMANNSWFIYTILHGLAPFYASAP